MKISFNTKIIQGPWGGGNKFTISLEKYLRNKGCQTVHNLDDNDIDIILMTNVRRKSETLSYNQISILKYLINKPDTIVVHRINNCDESRKTKNMNNYIINADKISDITVFISKYLEDVYIRRYKMRKNNYVVIKNGADSKIFNPEGRKKWNENEPMRIVTHHWSSNINKGFDVYQELDRISLSSFNGTKIIFTYIGNTPKNFSFLNSLIIPPIDGLDLSNKIKENHIYITGARGEGAGMHHIEAALCGLPILYINSGALPEYCNNFGVMFNNLNDLKDSLSSIIENYETYYYNMLDYQNTADNMCNNYENLFHNLLKNKVNLLGNLSKRQSRYRNIYLKEKIKNFFN